MNLIHIRIYVPACVRVDILQHCVQVISKLTGIQHVKGTIDILVLQIYYNMEPVF